MYAPRESQGSRKGLLSSSSSSFLKSVEASTQAPVALQSVTYRLEEENQHLKEQLSTTVEQYEASLEELKASNEELQAINEEMRSATEELETSKEECNPSTRSSITINHELKSNVEELSRVNNDLQNLMASTEIGTIFLDRQLRIKRFTPRVQELFNLIPTDIGRPLSDITHNLNYLALNADALRVLRDLHSSEREVQSNGHWFLARVLPYRTSDDRIDGVVLTFVDIAQRKQAEELLRASEELYRLAVEAALDYAILNLGADGRFRGWSRGAERMFGYSEAEVIGQPGDLIFTPEDRAAGAPDEERRRAIEEDRVRGERWLVRKDGSRFYAGGIITPLWRDESVPDGFIQVTQDLTEQRRAEEKRAALIHETTLLAERNRMAQELHDTLAQGFTGIKLQLDAAEEALCEAPDEARAHVARARDISQQSLVEARRSIQALRSPLIVGDSLAAALKRLAEQAAESKQVRFEQEGTPHPLPAEVESDLYRIGQEALNNALRHAYARSILMGLAYFDGTVRLRVKDDGQGFNPQEQPAGFGLIGMQERAHHHGMELAIQSHPGQGTDITVTVARPEG